MEPIKPAKILYFIDGPVPTKADYAGAYALAPGNVVYRNSQHVPAEPHALEQCDGVAGNVPEIYAKAFPKAEEALAKKKAEFDKLAEKVGDEAAPKAAKTPNKPATGDKPAWPGGGAKPATGDKPAS